MARDRIQIRQENKNPSCNDHWPEKSTHIAYHSQKKGSITFTAMQSDLYFVKAPGGENDSQFIGTRGRKKGEKTYTFNYEINDSDFGIEKYFEISHQQGYNAMGGVTPSATTALTIKRGGNWKGDSSSGESS